MFQPSPDQPRSNDRLAGAASLLQARTSPASRVDHWSKWAAMGFGLGASPLAPGTVGALGGIPLSWALLQIPGGWLVQLAIIGVLVLVGVPLCTRAARQLDKADPSGVVWDEIVTMPLVFLGCSPTQIARFDVLVVGFLLHRLFDISKLPPVSQLERFPEGWGIMLDDVGAALYGLLAFRLFAAPWLGL